MIVFRKSRHISSNFHKLRERFALTVKKYKFAYLENAQIDKIVTDVIKDSKDKFFHTFECR